MRKFLITCCFAALGVSPALAETAQTPFNLLVGDPSWLSEAQFLARSMNHEQGLRIMPIVGSGSVQAVQDLQTFPQIDAALITADALAYVKAQNLLTPGESKFAYISTVKTLPIFLVARKGIANVTALAGKKIATGPADSASFATGELLLGGLEVPFLRIPLEQEGAVEALVQGKADAALLVGVPLNFDKLGTNFKLLPIALPPQLTQTYKASPITHKLAPALVADGQQVESVETQLLLAVNDVPAQTQKKSLKLFEGEFFRQQSDNFAMLNEVVPGLNREANANQLVQRLPAPTTITPTGANP